MTLSDFYHYQALLPFIIIISIIANKKARGKGWMVSDFNWAYEVLLVLFAIASIQIIKEFDTAKIKLIPINFTHNYWIAFFSLKFVRLIAFVLLLVSGIVLLKYDTLFEKSSGYLRSQLRYKNDKSWFGIIGFIPKHNIFRIFRNNLLSIFAYTSYWYVLVYDHAATEYFKGWERQDWFYKDAPAYLFFACMCFLEGRFFKGIRRRYGNVSSSGHHMFTETRVPGNFQKQK